MYLLFELWVLKNNSSLYSEYKKLKDKKYFVFIFMDKMSWNFINHVDTIIFKNNVIIWSLFGATIVLHNAVRN